jgi:hypothetical protein
VIDKGLFYFSSIIDNVLKENQSDASKMDGSVNAALQPDGVTDRNKIATSFTPASTLLSRHEKGTEDSEGSDSSRLFTGYHRRYRLHGTYNGCNRRPCTL